MWTLPYNEIVKGMLRTMGLAYPATASPVGTIRCMGDDGGSDIDVSNVNSWSIGPYEAFLQRGSDYLPSVHIDPERDDTELDGPKAQLITLVYRIYYVALRDPILDADEVPFPPRRLSSRGKNPYIVVKTRAKALKNALELDWAYLGTEIKLNAHITNPTFENEWDEWCRKYNRERIVASFDVECALREVFPEVTLP